RVVGSVYEVTGLEGDALAGSELLAWSEGCLRWTGIRPRSSERLAERGVPMAFPSRNGDDRGRAGHRPPRSRAVPTRHEAEEAVGPFE
ncbi:MAG: hypothetical protein AB7U18_26050, partial [Dehalococcoidia bacterium]